MHVREGTFLSRVLTAIVPAMIAVMQRLFSLSLRRKYLNREALLSIKENKQPYILSVWHACVLWAPFFHRKHGIQAMVSPSRDGELIARVVEWSGNFSVRGSSRQGGARALRGLLKLLRQGHPACIVPDGPLGPAFELKPGVLALAQSTGVPIVPFHYEASRQWVARHAWDKHRIPRPFSTVYLSYGDPIYLEKSLSNEDFALAAEKIQKSMMENMYRCQKAAGIEPGRDT
tara:strand:+ start:54969 stop:55661 length:693 start_codon:yes stop_codon:yes gene_type:complete